MNLPEYVTKEEVRRICKELKIRDWSKLKKPDVPVQEAKKIMASIEMGDIKIGADDFRQGLEVELEHGTRYPEANVTNNHPALTGKIVLAHLKETLDYYKRLEVAELEGDVVKAVEARNFAKLEKIHKKLVNAKLVLAKSEVARLSDLTQPPR